MVLHHVHSHQDLLSDENHNHVPCTLHSTLGSSALTGCQESLVAKYAFEGGYTIPADQGFFDEYMAVFLSSDHGRLNDLHLRPTLGAHAGCVPDFFLPRWQRPIDTSRTVTTQIAGSLTALSRTPRLGSRRWRIL